MKDRPYAVICLWEYVPKNKDKPRIERRWKLVEAYGIDQDGYACTPSKYASNDRHSHHEFMNAKVWCSKETDTWSESPPPSENDAYDYDWRPRMGRAVTVWNMVGGTSLVDLHPPEWTEWLSSQFYSELKTIPNWHALLEGGYTLYSGTANEVNKLWGLT